MNEHLSKVFNNGLESFKQNCLGIPYEPKGISNSEGLFLWSLVKHYQPDILIESGVSRGRSTEIIANTKSIHNYKHFYAFDIASDYYEYTKNKLSKYKDVTYEIGNSYDKILEFDKKTDTASIGCFIDGPKGGSDLVRLIDILITLPKLQFIVFHDCYEGSVTRRDVTKFFRKRDPKEKVFQLNFLDKSYVPDLSINDALKKDMVKTHPEKVDLVDSRYVMVGVMLNRNMNKQI